MQIPKLEIEDFANSRCFACGQDNPIGLKLLPVYDGEKVWAEFTAGELYQGWNNTVHGGILYTLLDELTAYAILCHGIDFGVTAKSEVRFKHVAPINEPIQISAWVTKLTKRLVETKGVLTLKDNTIIGTGYNGNARGVINCSEIGCIKNMMKSPEGLAYDYCPAVHAEENAIINSNRADRIGATLYIAGTYPDGKYTLALPCQRCQRKIINSQIKQVILLRDDGTPMTINVEEYIKADTEWYTNLIQEAKNNPKNL